MGSQSFLWRPCKELSFGMWCHVVWQFSNISEEHTVSIFRVREHLYTKQATIQAEQSIFLWNVSKLLPVNTSKERFVGTKFTFFLLKQWLNWFYSKDNIVNLYSMVTGYSHIFAYIMFCCTTLFTGIFLCHLGAKVCSCTSKSKYFLIFGHGFIFPLIYQKCTA
jgi:hypothetical protein